MHDVLVVGAGPAGLAVALGAARAGLDVAICERRDGTLDKACGEGLMPGAIRSLAALGVTVPGHDIEGIAYHSAEMSAHAPFKHGPGRGVRRTVLDAELRSAVAAVGVPVLRESISSIEQFDDHVVAQGIPARYLVAADGLHSPIREHLGLARPTRARHRWGQRRHFAVAPSSSFVEVTWAAQSEAYVTPIAEDVVGVAILSAVRAPFAQQLAQFPKLCRQFADAEPRSQLRGAGPLRQRVTARVAGRVLLVGDAAGYIDALTGEGLALSFAAAAELVRCLVAEDPQSYERSWARVSRRSRLLTAGLLAARGHTATARCIVPLATRAPRLFGAVVNQLAE